jgi:excisionase family DNA binding protein
MGAYLTVEEVAERLGVEYKTVYRLVREGEIPAGRIGRIYRIREEDLNAYFDRQKQLLVHETRRSGLTALQDIRCGVCRRVILSELSIGGGCEATGRPICLACWSIHKIRRCPSEKDPFRTGVDLAHGVAVREEKGEVILPVLPSKQETETVDQIVARLRNEGKGVVTAEEARSLEEHMIRSFGQRLEEVDEVPDPLAKRSIRLQQCRVKHQIEMGCAGREDNGPANRISRFSLKSGGWGRPVSSLVLECRFLSRPEKIAAQHYDAEPINENELTIVLNELSTQAKKAGSFHVVLIGSPTGWTERAVSLVTQKTHLKGFRDRRVAVVLWDLHTEKVAMDPSDERLWAFWVLVAPKEYAAKVSDCVARIREVLARRNSLSLAEICWKRLVAWHQTQAALSL